LNEEKCRSNLKTKSEILQPHPKVHANQIFTFEVVAARNRRMRTDSLLGIECLPPYLPLITVTECHALANLRGRERKNKKPPKGIQEHAFD
jgi:hypothetical protein